MLIRMVTLAITLLCAATAEAAVQGHMVEYWENNDPLEGYVAYDDSIPSRRPGILVVHEWKGLNDYAKRRADQLAALGYVAFAADMYGKGVRAETHEEAAQLSGMYKKDRQLMRARVDAARQVLAGHMRVDPGKIGAIGYCFGGTTVLELARSGADVDGVVSFHGALETTQPALPGKVRAKVLVLHGADDPYIPQSQVAAFEKEMRAAGADYRVVQYPGAVHSFTVPEAGSDPSKGMAYNEEADRKSWEEMEIFFAGLFEGKR